MSRQKLPTKSFAILSALALLFVPTAVRADMVDIYLDLPFTDCELSFGKKDDPASFQTIPLHSKFVPIQLPCGEELKLVLKKRGYEAVTKFTTLSCESGGPLQFIEFEEPPEEEVKTVIKAVPGAEIEIYDVDQQAVLHEGIADENGELVAPDSALLKHVRVTARKEGFGDIVKTAEFGLPDGEIFVMDGMVAKPYTLTIRSEPSGATVFLNDVAVGVTPIENREIPFAEAADAVRIELDDYEPQSYLVEGVQPGKEILVPPFNLVYSKGGLKLQIINRSTGTPLTADQLSALYLEIGGEAYDWTDETLSGFGVGTKSIFVSHPLFKPFESEVQLSDEVVTETIELAPKPVFVEVAVEPEMPFKLYYGDRELPKGDHGYMVPYPFEDIPVNVVPEGDKFTSQEIVISRSGLNGSFFKLADPVLLPRNGCEIMSGVGIMERLRVDFSTYSRQTNAEHSYFTIDSLQEAIKCYDRHEEEMYSIFSSSYDRRRFKTQLNKVRGKLGVVMTNEIRLLLNDRSKTWGDRVDPGSRDEIQKETDFGEGLLDDHIFMLEEFQHKARVNDQYGIATSYDQSIKNVLVLKDKYPKLIHTMARRWVRSRVDALERYYRTSSRLREKELEVALEEVEGIRQNYSFLFTSESLTEFNTKLDLLERQIMRKRIT